MKAKKKKSVSITSIQYHSTPSDCHFLSFFFSSFSILLFFFCFSFLPFLFVNIFFFFLCVLFVVFVRIESRSRVYFVEHIIQFYIHRQKISINQDKEATRRRDSERTSANNIRNYFPFAFLCVIHINAFICFEP